MNQIADLDESDKIESRLPLWLAITANVVGFASALPFFWLQPGERVRPMGWPLWILFIGVAALVVLPLVLFNLRKLRGRSWPKYAIALSLTPVPLAFLVERFARTIVGYILEP